MNEITSQLRKRWREMFEALAAGQDVPPGQRLRVEGMMEAAVIVGEASEQELTDLMGHCFHEAFGRSLVDDFGEDWQDFFRFPQIPAFTRRAPVYPSTSE